MTPYTPYTKEQIEGYRAAVENDGYLPPDFAKRLLAAWDLRCGREDIAWRDLREMFAIVEAQRARQS